MVWQSIAVCLTGDGEERVLSQVFGFEKWVRVVVDDGARINGVKELGEVFRGRHDCSSVVSCVFLLSFIG